MKALTIWPEWAWAICALGKNVENRTWKPSEKQLELGDRFAIHAGARFGGKVTATAKPGRLMLVMDPVMAMAKLEWTIECNGRHVKADKPEDRFHYWVCKQINQIHVGAIVATATLQDILIPGYDDPEKHPWWASDQFGWKFDNVQVLPVPIACKGNQGLWNIPGYVLEHVIK